MGKLRLPGHRSRGQQGYILLDVLAALAIALIGLAVFLGSLAGAGRLTAAQAERVSRTLEQRNSDATSQVISIPSD